MYFFRCFHCNGVNLRKNVKSLLVLNMHPTRDRSFCKSLFRRVHFMATFGCTKYLPKPSKHLCSRFTTSFGKQLKMKNGFIIIDLDGTILHEQSRNLISQDLCKLFEEWRAKGNRLAVCSNNIRAKSILQYISLDSYFDFIIGSPSGNFKTSEILECWQCYRYLCRKGVITSKIKLHNMILIDNDLEICENIETVFDGAIKCYRSIHQFQSGVILQQTPPTAVVENKRDSLLLQIKKKFCINTHSCLLLPPWNYSLFPSSEVFVCCDARTADHLCGMRHTKFHLHSHCLALLPTEDHQNCINHTIAMSKCIQLQEALQYRHELCKLCQYGLQDIIIK